MAGRQHQGEAAPHAEADHPNRAPCSGRGWPTSTWGVQVAERPCPVADERHQEVIRRPQEHWFGDTATNPSLANQSAWLRTSRLIPSASWITPTLATVARRLAWPGRRALAASSAGLHCGHRGPERDLPARRAVGPTPSAGRQKRRTCSTASARVSAIPRAPRIPLPGGPHRSPTRRAARPAAARRRSSGSRRSMSPGTRELRSPPSHACVGAALRPRRRVGDGAQQRVLRFEVAIERPRRKPGLVGDVGHRGVAEPVAAHDGEGGVHDQPNLGLRVEPPGATHPGGRPRTRFRHQATLTRRGIFDMCQTPLEPCPSGRP